MHIVATVKRLFLGPEAVEQPSFEEIERVATEHDPWLLMCAMDHGSMSTDTWWRLCEGRFTAAMQKHLPTLTDARLLEFVKHYQRRGTHDEAALSQKLGLR